MPALGLALGLPYGRKAASVPANSAESQQFFDRLFTPPTPGGAEEIRWNAFIDGGVADGWWQKMDAMTLWFAGANEGDANVNLIQSAYNTERYQTSGAVTYTQGQGYSGGGANRCLISNFNPATASGAKFTRNDASFGMLIYSTATVGQAAINNGARTGGGMTSLGNVELYPKYNSTVGYHNCDGTEESFPAPDASADSSGFYIVQRTGANAAAVYRNDMVTPVDTSTSASTALVDSEIWYRVQHSCRMAFIGGSLTEAQRIAFKSRLQTLVTAISGVFP
jgi:hypothetical protein